MIFGIISQSRRYFVRRITGSPTKEVTVVVCLIVTDNVPLVLCKLPRTYILQVSFREIDLVTVRVDSKCTG